MSEPTVKYTIHHVKEGGVKQVMIDGEQARGDGGVPTSGIQVLIEHNRSYYVEPHIVHKKGPLYRVTRIDPENLILYVTPGDIVEFEFRGARNENEKRDLKYWSERV